MPLSLEALSKEPRLLIEADLRPVQGNRFQPTGFPNLGHAVYDAPEGTKIVLVESAQSMANRFEAVCWNEAADDWVPPLKGLPVVKVLGADKKPLTNSVLEAHRINSEYIARTEEFKNTIEKAIQFQKDKPFDIHKQLIPVLFRYDINSLIHGVFLEEVAGVIRLPRTLSAFIEATKVNPAQSGGVKINRVEPTLKEGLGNVPYPREEYTAEKIVAYFNLDLRQIRSFALKPEAEHLLVAIALFKIQAFLDVGLRLRTACDLELGDMRVTRPEAFTLPTLQAVTDALPGLIEAVSQQGMFNDPPALTVTYKK